MWHVGIQLPWCWRSGPSNSSERDHVKEMLREETFPEKTLFCGDAGFVGYELWSTILKQGHSFLFRVGSNVTLLRNLGYVIERDGIVYLWPDREAKKHKPPLVLRLWQFQLGGTQVFLVSNVLQDEELNAQQVKELYQLRWGIELQFRTFKQTLGRRKMRSRTPERALRELDWSLVGLWLVQLLAIREQIALGIPPSRSSAAQTLNVLREMFLRWSEIPDHGEDWKSRMQQAVHDDYKRKKSKKARYQPNYKDKPSAGPPELIEANDGHKENLKELQKYNEKKEPQNT